VKQITQKRIEDLTRKSFCVMEIVLTLSGSRGRKVEIIKEGDGFYAKSYHLKNKKKFVFHRAYRYTTTRIPGTDVYVTTQGEAYSSDHVTKYVYKYDEPFCKCYYVNVVSDKGKPVKEYERGDLADLLLKGLIANMNKSDKLKHQLNYFKLKYNEEFDGISESSEDESSTD